MNLFQIGLLFSLPVNTYLLTCETGYWSIFINVYMTGCVKCHMHFSTFVFANESWFFVCRVLSFIFYWFGMVRWTGNVTDRPRAPTPREDRLISRRARQRPFSTAGALRGNLAFGGHISTHTVIRRLHHQGMRARRSMKRP